MTKTPIWLDDTLQFPDVKRALKKPNGLLAVGGDLSPARLLAAYRAGIFPWYEAKQPILWWSPNPRAVLFFDDFKISRSLQKTLKKQIFTVTFDHNFADVIQACADTRAQDTWITLEMMQAYQQLHTLGFAHSVEIWCDDRLVGGLYGLAIGKIFCGESMFSIQTDASKVAMVYLVEKLKQAQFAFIDCQVPNPHLLSLGVTTIPRAEYIKLLQQYGD